MAKKTAVRKGFKPDMSKFKAVTPLQEARAQLEVVQDKHIAAVQEGLRLKLELAHTTEQRDDAQACINGAEQAAEIAQTELTAIKDALKKQPYRKVVVTIQDENGVEISGAIYNLREKDDRLNLHVKGDGVWVGRNVQADLN